MRRFGARRAAKIRCECAGGVSSSWSPWMSSVGAVMRAAAAIGLTSSTRNWPIFPASSNALREASRGREERGALGGGGVQIGECGDRDHGRDPPILRRRLQRHRGAHGDAHDHDRVHRHPIEDAPEVLLLVRPVRADIAARLAVRAAVVGDDLEPARHEMTRDPDGRPAVVPARRGERRRSRASPRVWNHQPFSLTPAPSNSTASNGWFGCRVIGLRFGYRIAFAPKDGAK